MNIRETAHMTSRELGKEKGYCFKELKRRNSTLTTIAPTGTLSILAGCSSSIEPIFGKNATKTVLGDIKLDLGSKYKDVKDDLLVTAHEIPFEKHIEMQANFQEYTDNAVSKTINLPNSATESDVRKAFLLAHSLGCKGLTVYRDGSRQAPIEISTEGELSECEDGKCLI
jgi:ribonucleoside-diphosphate reductase alpha chain